MTANSCSPARVDDVDVPESRDRRAVTHGVHLNRLTLRVTKRAAQEVALLAANHIQARPELWRLHLICDVLEHPDDLAALDLVEDLAAKLRVVPLLVDRERSVADDRAAAICRRDEIGLAEIFVARQ